ncbi:polysaccharide biosynthesis/export family protein [Methylobacterium sp. J-090]|uniref:polysaccharide biosynthesis/export family protein n=1 Tax=Methylobacterium sp. J-090 TaxID=2836666 RepID=UPI001FB9160D|nr:polysaccharide biosynthesis/export family protein [Methylobacterium sp. J-090]MCJ2082817.1 polysaccharide biosynthesis/export family protein [Methylobacterium sp. J-090]
MTRPIPSVRDRARIDHKDTTMPRHGLSALLSVLLLATPAFTVRALAGDYRLGPQDKLEVRVHDLRTGTGEAHQWGAFDGEFVVDAAGNVSLPLLGEMQAGGGTTADLARALAARVQTKVGLAQLPSAAVQVVKYRPFYITGAVDKPGEYEYRPGLTVLQSAAIAGGLMRPRDGALLGFEREALSQRGDLRMLAADRQGLLIRQARLTAEISEAETVTYPAETRTSGTGLDASRAIREETLLFEARRNALKAQVGALGKARMLLTQELASLDSKDEALSRQIDLIRKELTQVSGLVTKGLAVAPRQFAIEQSVAAYEGNRIDIQVGRLRAQQDLSRIERESLDLQAKRRNEALTEAGEVRAKLASVAERTETAASLIYQAEVRSPMSVADLGGAEQPVYALTRRVGEATETRIVSESDTVEPGDVVRITVPRRAPPAVTGNAQAAADVR